MGKRFSDSYGIPGAKAVVLFSIIFFMLTLFGPPPVAGKDLKHTGAASGELSSKKKVIEWEGNESEMAKPFAGIVANEKDWKALWKKAFKKKAPAVNFKKYAVACVFLGHYPGWWYHICFGEPEVSGSTQVVHYGLVDLRVELMDDGKRGLSREYGSRGQYRMRSVQKKPGFSMRLEQDGRPQVALKKGFSELLEKQATGLPD